MRLPERRLSIFFGQIKLVESQQDEHKQAQAATVPQRHRSSALPGGRVFGQRPGGFIIALAVAQAGQAV